MKLNFTLLFRYLIELRERYLRVGSDSHIPIEIMKKWILHVPRNWTVRYLQNMQRTVVESLLLYWYSDPSFFIILISFFIVVINYMDWIQGTEVFNQTGWDGQRSTGCSNN